MVAEKIALTQTTPGPLHPELRKCQPRIFCPSLLIRASWPRAPRQGKAVQQIQPREKGGSCGFGCGCGGGGGGSHTLCSRLCIDKTHGLFYIMVTLVSSDNVLLQKCNHVLQEIAALESVWSTFRISNGVCTILVASASAGWQTTTVEIPPATITPPPVAQAPSSHAPSPPTPLYINFQLSSIRKKSPRTRCESPPHKWFTVGCSPPFTRLVDHLTALSRLEAISLPGR